MANYSNPTPDKRLEVLYRQTFNTYCAADATSYTIDNQVGNAQKVANALVTGRLYGTAVPKGVMAGSVVAVSGAGTVGPCIGDSSTTPDKAVGIAVNNILGNPYESSSGIASGKIVYAHGTGTVIRTDIYEVVDEGSVAITYIAGDLVYSSANGLLSKYAVTGTDGTYSTYGYTAVGRNATPIGIVLEPPSSANSYYMTVQLKI